MKKQNPSKFSHKAMKSTITTDDLSPNLKYSLINQIKTAGNSPTRLTFIKENKPHSDKQNNKLFIFSSTSLLFNSLKHSIKDFSNNSQSSSQSNRVIKPFCNQLKKPIASVSKSFKTKSHIVQSKQRDSNISKKVSKKNFFSKNFSKKQKNLNEKILKGFKLSQKSKNLFESFTNEFLGYIHELDFDLTGFLNYSKFCKALEKLRFIQDYFYKSAQETDLVLKAWKRLGGLKNNKIKINDLFVFLLAVLNIFETSNVKTSPRHTHKKFPFVQTKQEVNKIHCSFIIFFNNRTLQTSGNWKITKEPKVSEKTQNNENTENIENFDIAETSILIENPKIESPKIENPKQENPKIGNPSNLESNITIPVKKYYKTVSLREVSALPKEYFKKWKKKEAEFKSITPKSLFYESENEEIHFSPLMTVPNDSEWKRWANNKIKVQKIEKKSEVVEFEKNDQSKVLRRALTNHSKQDVRENHNRKFSLMIC